MYIYVVLGTGSVAYGDWSSAPDKRSARLCSHTCRLWATNPGPSDQGCRRAYICMATGYIDAVQSMFGTGGLANGHRRLANVRGLIIAHVLQNDALCHVGVIGHSSSVGCSLRIGPNRR
jgi:hypothetical protein